MKAPFKNFVTVANGSLLIFLYASAVKITQINVYLVCFEDCCLKVLINIFHQCNA